MIGKRLKELLIKNNVTQAELCRKLGISPGAMSNFINDRRSPSFAVIASVAHYFSVSIDSFVAGSPADPANCLLSFSQLPERIIAQSRCGLWIKVDTDYYSPGVRQNSLVFTDKAIKPADRDCVIFFKRNTPSFYKLLEKSGGFVLIPMRKDDLPVEIGSAAKGIYKVLYVAGKP